LTGIFHSAVVFFLAKWIYEDTATSSEGKTLGLWELGIFAFSAVIFIVTSKVALETRCFILFSKIFEM
jgi:hypothetical protein